MNRTPHLVFAGGGTAGHLFPGLAVAEVLQRSGLPMRMTFIGTGRQFEVEHVARAGHAYQALPCRPLPSGPREAWRFLAANVKGYYTARRLLRAENAALVVGLGGYASAATVRAAAALGIPYILLESNAVPGRATRWLAARAELVCATFEQVRTQLPHATKLHLTGTPVRRAFRRVRREEPSQPANRRRQLVVLGGSGGSHSLNEQVPRAIYKAQATLADWKIIHQTGQREAGETAALYDKLGLCAKVLPFADNLAPLLAASDLVVSRAGGSTLAELTVCGVPAILVPYPTAADDHQRKNAEVFAALKAARLLDSREVEGRFDNALATSLAELAGNERMRRRMAENMKRLGRPDAARRVARSVARLAGLQKLAST